MAKQPTQDSELPTEAKEVKTNIITAPVSYTHLMIVANPFLPAIPVIT